MGWQGRRLPHRCRCSTLSAGRLNRRVRDGVRVYPCRSSHQHPPTHSSAGRLLLHTHSRALTLPAELPSPRSTPTSPRPLVPVRCGRCRPSTSGLSSWSSPSGLPLFRGGASPLRLRFPLRCCQRFSPPELATRLCTWRCNRHTSAPSIPVLSY